jgi:hypothetical protein
MGDREEKKKMITMMPLEDILKVKEMDYQKALTETLTGQTGIPPDLLRTQANLHAQAMQAQAMQAQATATGTLSPSRVRVVGDRFLITPSIIRRSGEFMGPFEKADNHIAGRIQRDLLKQGPFEAAPLSDNTKYTSYLSASRGSRLSLKGVVKLNDDPQYGTISSFEFPYSLKLERSFESYEDLAVISFHRPVEVVIVGPAEFESIWVNMGEFFHLTGFSFELDLPEGFDLHLRFERAGDDYMTPPLATNLATP